MNNKKDTQESEDHLSILRSFHNNPEASQRELANNLDVSLGKLNYLVKELVKKGFVKIQNFKKSEKKSSYFYVITPQGISQKIKLTQSFMKRKMKEYEELKKDL
jgi:EPS-associated MarR family transcriptional regulator